MNVLIVDDNATNRKLLRVTLEAEGLNVVEAGDGIEALGLLDSAPADAIISDILMPRMDGYRFCYEVRGSKRFGHLPFIIYTSTYTSPGDEKVGLDLGADRFIRKPSPASEILAALHALKERPRPVRSGHIPPPRGLELMKEYNEALVRKLEEKNTDLELLADQLTQANQVLTVKSRELERTKEELLNTNVALEMRVRERTAELQTANRELESFSHSVAHDLRAPLRAIDGYSRIVMREFTAGLSAEGAGHLARITENAGRMGQFIEDLLNLAHAGFLELVLRPVNLSHLADEIAEELRRSQPERAVEFAIASDVMARGDKVLLQAALENLLGNAWKYTGKAKRPRIEFGTRQDGALTVYFVRDNGAGFDMAYADKLFSPFQRLHSEPEFSGTGIGLATVQRIVKRHGGLVWAESKVGEGATFYFTLGEPAKTNE
ncbi:MAG TPA: response regulator [Verrucomicrobiae bacterium]|nr:response regulator [Verrucomicrobiae bacterium]